jgi:hypothetical protein
VEKLVGLITELGLIEGRDAIYLDRIIFNNETNLTLTGDFNIYGIGGKFEMNFKGVIFLSTIELDFDKRRQMESLGIIENSDKIKEFRSLDHSSKINDRHKHYYVQTYDTVFEIISDEYELVLID